MQIVHARARQNFPTDVYAGHYDLSRKKVHFPTLKFHERLDISRGNEYDWTAGNRLPAILLPSSTLHDDFDY